MLWIITGIIGSYLIGSVPTAYIFGRWLKGIDIRKFGSRNVGATNALRVLGKPVGITVLILDMLKGFVPVVFLADFLVAKNLPLESDILRVILGIGCICGHIWTVFLGFKGGKGVASTFGVLAGLALRISGLKIVTGLVVLTWLLLFILTRIVSISSIVAVLALPIYMLVFKQHFLLALSSFFLAIFITLRHKDNIRRLFQRKEPRVF